MAAPAAPPRSFPNAARRALTLGAVLCAIALSGCERRKVAPDQEAAPNHGTLELALPTLPSPAARRTEAPAEPRDHVPEGFERADVVGVRPTERGHAVVLRAGQRALPIFVGETEGLSIQLRLSGERFHRPLTHDLLDAALAELGGTIESVRVERYEEQTFYAVVVLQHAATRHELDSRTSDAIALALGHDVPIYVRSSVLDSSSVDLQGLLPTDAEDAEKGAPSWDTRGPRARDTAERSPYEPFEADTVAL